MQIKTKNSLDTEVDFGGGDDPGFQTAKVRGTHSTVEIVTNKGRTLFLNPEEARFLADLINEAAGIVEKNTEVKNAEPNFTGFGSPTNGLERLTWPYPNTHIFTSKPYKVFASDVHGWTKDGRARI